MRHSRRRLGRAGVLAAMAFPLLAAAMAFPLLAAVRPAPAAPVATELPNGLSVVVLREAGSGRAAAVLMVRAGDADDPPNASGAARVLGRLLTQPANHGQTSRWEAAAVSGASRVVTEPDVTAFSIATTPDQAGAAIRRLGLMVEEPLWDRTLVMRAVREEVEADRDDPPDAWTHDFDVWQARAGLPVPPPRDPEPPGRETLEAAYRRLYTPDRMVLAVAGDVQPDAVLAAARAAFRQPESLSARLATRRRRPVAVSPGPPSDNYAFVGVKAPPATAPDAAAVEVLAAALGLGKTSGVFQGLRDREGTGYESGVVYPRRLTDSGVAIYALAPGRVSESRDALLSVWKLAGTVPEGGWDTARARAAHAYAAQHQTARDRAYWLGFWELSGQGAAYDATYLARLRTVSDVSIAAAAKRYLTAEPVRVP